MACAGANGLGTIPNLKEMAFLKISYGTQFMVKGYSHSENGGKKFFTPASSTIGRHRPLVGTYSFVHKGLKFVQLVKTANKHKRFIEDLGDDIRLTLDFGFYVHPIILRHTCKAQ